MSIQLHHTQPRAIEVKMHENSAISLGDYDFGLNAFLESAQKALVGETIEWNMPQLDRESPAISMQALIKNKRTRSTFAGVQIGQYKISADDFFCVIKYVLINTNLIQKDPRPKFIRFVAAIDHTRSYMDSMSWANFVGYVTALKSIDGHGSYTYGKRTNTGARRLGLPY